MRIGDTVFVHGHVDEIRKDTVIIRNNGGYFGTVPSEIICGELPVHTGSWWQQFNEEDAEYFAVCSECRWETNEPWEKIHTQFAYCPKCGSYNGDEKR